MKNWTKVLIVDDDAAMRLFLEEELHEAGYVTLSASSGDDALERLAGASVDVVITDVEMPGMKGDELLLRMRSREPEIPVVVITAFGSIQSAVEAIKAGAYHYVAKPFRIEQLLVTLDDALRERRLKREIASLRESIGGDAFTIVSQSPAMRRTMGLVLRAAPADTSVLLLGESGTGKELLARALHLQGPRRAGPFLAMNCSAIPETLLESQLFGHRRGSFTDAREDRRGLFQEAEGGTLLLDEIGDMPIGLQAKMLRVLQNREVHPLGAPAPLHVNVRVVAATHRNLETLVAEGRFRQDLYYRLNVISVRVPPLRERPEDILPLAAHFLEKHGKALGRTACTLSVDAVAALRKYAWPGNVRELENAIERALVLGCDDAIWPEDLPESLRTRADSAIAPSQSRPLSDVEREHILRTLDTVRGNKTAAARLLGLDRKTLYRKLDLYGIRTPC